MHFTDKIDYQYPQNNYNHCRNIHLKAVMSQMFEMLVSQNMRLRFKEI